MTLPGALSDWHPAVMTVLAEYELVQKPSQAVPRTDAFDDSDWEKVESEEDEQPDEEEEAGLSKALYAEVAALGGQK